MMMHISRRPLLLPALAAYSFLIAGCSGQGTPVRLTPRSQETIPSCPPPIVITVEPSPTVSPEPTRTETAAPTSIVYPTRAPVYRVHKCVVLSTGAPWASSLNEKATYTFCVMNIKFGQDGFMMVDVYFSGNAGNSELVVTLPPSGPANSSIRDDLGNKYEWTNRGGCAKRAVNINSGKGCSGWFVYPAVSHRATTIDVYDEWYGTSISGISLVGVSAQETITPTP